MKLVDKICRFIAKRWYPYLESARDSYAKKRLLETKGNFAQCGEKMYLGVDYDVCGEQYIRLGENFSAAKHFRLDAIDSWRNQKFTPTIVIGDNVSFQDYCHIGAIESVEIGDGCMFASKVYISDHYHGKVDKSDLGIAPGYRPLTSKPIKIGKECWIGDNVSILPGVELGDNVIVGANAVVTHSFSANSVIAGCPAKVIKMLK